MNGSDFDPIDTYTISEDGKTITCKRCGLTSHHVRDVEERYCSNCKTFHDDIWPPVRKWWIEQGKQDRQA